MHSFTIAFYHPMTRVKIRGRIIGSLWLLLEVDCGPLGKFLIAPHDVLDDAQS